MLSASQQASKNSSSPKASVADLSALLSLNPKTILSWNPDSVADQHELQPPVLRGHEHGSDKMHSMESLPTLRAGFQWLKHGWFCSNGQTHEAAWPRQGLHALHKLPIHRSLGCPQKAMDQM